MELHILDTSNYIYAGAFGKLYISRGVRQSGGEYEANEAPIGGVRFLLKNVFSFPTDAVVMPVFDRTPTIKREMYADLYGDQFGYKGTRPTKTVDITYQKEYAEWILRDLGYPVQAIDGYEADDVIYSLVQYYKDDFEHIYIHTRDSDLSFLVSDKVSIAQVGTLGKVIDMNNYTSVADKTGYCAYNTVHLRKMCTGDKSDNIPGVGWKWAELIDACIIDKDENRKLGDLNIARSYIKKAIMANPMVEGSHLVLKTFNMVCPLLVPESEIDDCEQAVNSEKIAYYANNWNSSLDKWKLEDALADYIDQYYD